MTIFSRYVFGQAASALLLILLSLTGIVWISLALRELNVVTSSGQSALTLVKMTTLGLPNFVAILSPFALLIAAIHALNRLSSDSEIIVLTASGATAWTIAKPIALLGVIVAMGVAYVNHVAMPWSLRLLRATIVEVRTDVLTQVIQPGRFSSPEPGLTFHIRERTTNGELQDLLVYDARDREQVQSYLAERAVIVEQNNTAYMVMTNGHILRAAGQGEPVQIIAFEKYAVDLDQFDKETEKTVEFKPRERYTSELLNPDPSDEGYRRAPGRYVAELHERSAAPLYPIAFALLAVALVGQAQSTRQARGSDAAVCFALGVTIRLIGMAATNVVAAKPHLAPVLYVVPTVAILLALTLIVRGNRSGFRLDLVSPINDLTQMLANTVKRRKLATGAS